MKASWLIAGLGNPSEKYSMNRHNIGWMVAAALAKKYNQILKKNSFFFRMYYYTTLDMFSNKIFVALPATYMNNSGIPIQKISKKYSIPPEKILTIVDEYNFPLGKIHLKQGGGDGGHNGISSVIYEIKSENFFRLRCGIGRNFMEGGLVNYVLSDFNNDEITQRDSMIKKAIQCIEYFIENGPAKAMSAINSGELWR